VSLKEAYHVLFEDNKFQEEFHKQRNDTQVKYEEWTKWNNGILHRTVQSIVKIPASNVSIPGIPTQSKVLEHHTLEMDQKSIKVQLSVCSLDVPYGKDFRLQILIQINEISAKCCQFQVSVGVLFIKEPWCIGNIIRKSAIQSSKDTYLQWFDIANKFLQEESKKTSTIPSVASPIIKGDEKKPEKRTSR